MHVWYFGQFDRDCLPLTLCLLAQVWSSWHARVSPERARPHSGGFTSVLFTRRWEPVHPIRPPRLRWG